MKRDPLYALLEARKGFVREAPTPIEQMSLVGRSLTVAGDLLGGVAEAGNRTSKVARAVATVGNVVIGLARVLVPGGIEGHLFRHWTIIAALIDILLIVFATLGLVNWSLALTAAGYTLVVAFVVEGARYVARSREGATARVLRLVMVTGVLAVSLFALFFSLTLSDIIRIGASDRIHLTFAGLKAHGLQVGSFSIGVALLVAIGLAWGKLVTSDRRGRLAWLGESVVVAAPLVLLFALASTTRLILPAGSEGASFLIGACVTSAILGLLLAKAAGINRDEAGPLVGAVSAVLLLGVAIGLAVQGVWLAVLGVGLLMVLVGLVPWRRSRR